ncbi:short transient receptor potential channel 1-like isoform X1 [Branchiostoma lanceolatum]|uniref:short transient receptor potential channel 1-like isoform X1 n=1 Tax=Branchiostoma lanceolatum TaxID=7740 RepID=UPI0034512CCF
MPLRKLRFREEFSPSRRWSEPSFLPEEPEPIPFEFADTWKPPREPQPALSIDERFYLAAVEKGDLVAVQRILKNKDKAGQKVNIHCVDQLGRSALLIAIEHDLSDITKLLLSHDIYVGDALLFAVNEEAAWAVELLLDHRPMHKASMMDVVESVCYSNFAPPDVSPVMLAAHRDNYDIIKILVKRGAYLPSPHTVGCDCVYCTSSSERDSLRHSRRRLNIYRALASPSLMALTEEDPIHKAWILSNELKRLSFVEVEFKSDYEKLSAQCKKFSTDLLDEVRDSKELLSVLNAHNPNHPEPVKEKGGVGMSLARLKLAVEYGQKEFVARPSCQQLLNRVWYSGVPRFRTLPLAGKLLVALGISLVWPLLSVAYLVAPRSGLGSIIRSPAIKFISHSASYIIFLVLLYISTYDDFSTISLRKYSGPPLTTPEYIIMVWVLGMVWAEVKQLWRDGVREFVSESRNWMSYIMNFLYIVSFTLKIVAHLKFENEDACRSQWGRYHPNLVAEALFAVANIFSFLRLTFLYTASPVVGPLQISVGRMLPNIFLYLALFGLVLLSFTIGLQQLYWVYNEVPREHIPTNIVAPPPAPQILIDISNEYAIANGTCSIEAATYSAPGIELPNNSYTCQGVQCPNHNDVFSSVHEAVLTLFWYQFSMAHVQIYSSNTGVQKHDMYTGFLGAVMVGCYNIIVVIVLTKLLNAMLQRSICITLEHEDTEWKYAHTKLWMSYFEDSATLPPPLNLVPSPKSCYYCLTWISAKLRDLCGGKLKKFSVESDDNETNQSRRSRSENTIPSDYREVMRKLVQRWLTHRRRKDRQSKEALVERFNELKQELANFRKELRELLKKRMMKIETKKLSANLTTPLGSASVNYERTTKEFFI